MIDPKSSPRGHHIASYRIGVGHLGASWGVLGRLGRKKWPTWLQLGSQNGAKAQAVFAQVKRMFFVHFSLFLARPMGLWA